MKAHNPYAPPEAPVADAVPEALTEPPRQTLWAIRLIWIAWAIESLATLLHWTPVPAKASGTAWVLGTVFSAGLIAWITRKLKAGRNWMRITLVVLALIGIPGLIVENWLGLYRISWVDVVQQLLGVAATWLIWRPSREWFRQASKRVRVA